MASSKDKAKSELGSVVTALKRSLTGMGEGAFPLIDAKVKEELPRPQSMDRFIGERCLAEVMAALAVSVGAE